MAKKKRRTRRSSDSRQFYWARWNDDELLDLRLCDLGLTLQGTWLEEPILTIKDDLVRRGLTFNPHFWLSSEWFSPADIPGVAIPFYLAHPRLMRLERRQLLEVEGGTRKECMRILRHEVGHALQHAYQLQRRRKWQRQFGKSSKRYPEFYQPRPRSKRYVLHLDYWYAQSHPDEDFAETFAVWFSPRSQWRKRYRGWPALKKLEYVDELMAEIAGEKPPVRSRVRVESLPKLRMTLREHYGEKRERYGADLPTIYDRDLRRLFSDSPKHRHRETAASFLRRTRTEFRREIARWTGEGQFTLDQVFKEMIIRSKELKLRVVGHERRVKMDFAILLTMQTMNYLYRGRHIHPL